MVPSQLNSRSGFMNPGLTLFSTIISKWYSMSHTHNIGLMWYGHPSHTRISYKDINLYWGTYNITIPQYEWIIQPLTVAHIWIWVKTFRIVGACGWSSAFCERSLQLHATYVPMKLITPSQASCHPSYSYVQCIYIYIY